MSLGQEELFSMRSKRQTNSIWDWLLFGGSIWLVGGLFLDGWAHNHIQLKEVFFTPWHAVLYSAFFFLCVLAIIKAMKFEEATGTSEKLRDRQFHLGLLIFLMGGLADLAWHELFGLEVGLDSLLSPSHLLLAIGIGTITAVPLRFTVQAMMLPDVSVQLRRILSLIFLFSVLSFHIQFLHPFAQLWPLHQGSTNSQTLGIASMLFYSAFISAFILTLQRLQSLISGALTLFFVINGALLIVLYDHYDLIPVTIVCGIVADVIIALASKRFSENSKKALYYSTAIISATTWLIYLGYFVLSGTFVWSPHLAGGSVLLAGVTGFLTAELVVPNILRG